MNTETAGLESRTGVLTVTPRATLFTLIRREFWEHASLWLAPLITAAVIALTTLYSMTIAIDVAGHKMLSPNDSERIMILNTTQMVFAALVYLVAVIVVSWYALDCLYAERKDRSILFWKSLPVSDGMTVLAKFLVCVVVVPLGVFVLAAAAHLFALAAWKVRASFGGLPDLVSWNFLAWLRGEATILLCLLIAALWYAPVVAATLLLSAWARRSPLLWAVLLPLGAILLEYLLFRTHHVAQFLHYRTFGIWKTLADTGINYGEDTHLLRDLNWGGVFGNANLWLGVIAAGAMLYGAARIRRYRDDT